MVKTSIFKNVQENIKYITIYVYIHNLAYVEVSIGKCNKQNQLILWYYLEF